MEIVFKILVLNNFYFSPVPQFILKFITLSLTVTSKDICCNARNVKLIQLSRLDHALSICYVCNRCLLSFSSLFQSREDIHLQTKYVKARSCLNYLVRGKIENGFYWLFDDHDKRYVAYCDMSSEPGAAWTLVMSWSLANKDLPQFGKKSFMEDAPVNHNTPNWYIYRQTLTRMKSIRSQSTYWRATCSFDKMQQKITGIISEASSATWTS